MVTLSTNHLGNTNMGSPNHGLFQLIFDPDEGSELKNEYKAL